MLELVDHLGPADLLMVGELLCALSHGPAGVDDWVARYEVATRAVDRFERCWPGGQNWEEKMSR